VERVVLVYEQLRMRWYGKVSYLSEQSLCLGIVSKGKWRFLPWLLAAIDVTARSREGCGRGETKNHMSRAYIILIALFLSGCFAEQQQLVASCEFDALHTYPREQLATGAHIGDYMQTCMKMHGYNWNLTDKRCQVTTTVERNPYCYTPNNWLAARRTEAL
jgi:hypothetical protein